MKSLANATNGVMCLADSFAMAIFKQSFLRTLQPGVDGGLKMGFNATFDVQVRFGGLARSRRVARDRDGEN